MVDSTQDAQPKGFLRRLTGIAVVVLIQLVVFVALLEIVARIVDPIGISYYNETARFFDEVIVEEPIGYRLRPGLSGRFNGVQVDVNELGMRDRPVSEIKAPGEFRILAMGDSVIFSVGVEADDTIPAQLERIANASAPAGRSYRVLNMGVPSYNTLQELEQLKQTGQYLQADAAFLFIIPNDMQDKMWVLSKRSNAIVDLSQRSYALGLLFYTGRWLINMAGVSTNPQNSVTGGDAPVPGEGKLRELSADELAARQAAIRAKALADPAWQDIENSVVEIHGILAEQGVPLLVMHRENFKTTYIGRLRELGEQYGFAVEKLDIWNDPRWAELDKSEFVNSPVDSHCNAAGCELHAIRIHELLQEHGLLERVAAD